MDKLDDLKKQYERLGTAIEKLEQDAKTRSHEAMLWPQVGDEYWFIDDLGDKEDEEWDGNEFDHYRLAIGNCHRTEAEALAYREYQKDPRVVARGMIERMEGFDFNGLGAIAMHDQVTPRAYQYKDALPNGGLRFTDEDVASLVVDKHLDLCKVALGVITDKEEAGRIVRLAIGNVSDSGEAMGRG